ncbi:arginyl-tRNA--protein transferase 1-like [Bidens hawaiensis]|uniref:arginyl-tRNA--protein transferase 1-like n=1 Tax=Bidens hawaiensis TaxID=980011 RepID=UPI004049B107
MADKRKIKSEASSSSSSSKIIIDNNNNNVISVVVDVGRRRSSCGYCKSGSNSSITHGLWAHSLTVHDYQALLDRGWRRSGCFLYKPEMEKTCCPSYTIRLKATDFLPSKEQARVSKRMQRFLDGSLNIKNSDERKETSSAAGSAQKDGLQSNNIDQTLDFLSDQINLAILTCIEQGEFQFSSEIQFPKASVKSVAPNKRKLQVEESQDLVYTSNISFQIAAAFKRAQKNVGMGKDPKAVAETIANRLTNSSSAISLSVKACNGHINFYSTESQTQPDATVEKPAVSKASSSDDTSEKFPVKRQSLEIRLKRSTFDPEEYELYRKYQIKVHNDAPDHVTESSYKRFLIDSPLIYVQSKGDGSVPSCGFGSFHQQYLINGKLVAVGVVDILPKCLSSKYLFWDPDLAFLSLGKYSALQEINWVKESQTHCPSLQYYYLGYYIHSCNKMRYKAAYRPSELLCPLRYEWVSFDIAKRLLDRKPYVVLSDYATLQNELDLLPIASEDQIEQEVYESNDIRVDGDEEMSEGAFEDSDYDDEDDELVGPEFTSLTPAEMRKDVSNIIIGLRGMNLKYKDIREAFGVKEREYLESQLDKYVRAVGTDLSEQMIYSVG